MFAIALWDERGSGCCWPATASGSSRSTTGSPAGDLAFASELKAMLEQPGFSREIDPQAVAAYLAFNSIPAPLTIFAEARKLPAGSPARPGEGGEVDGPPLRAAAAGRRRRASARRGTTSSRRSCASVLRDSVRAHLVADVPVGVLLSGGVDSGGLAALAAAESGEPRAAPSRSASRRAASTSSAARAWSPSATAPTTTSWSLRPDAVELLPKLVEAFDEPFGDSSALPTYLVSELAAGEVKVALSGEGGDELFGGYYTYVADLLAPPRRPPGDARRGRWSRRCPAATSRVGFDYKAKRFARAAALPPLERHHAWKEIFSAAARGPSCSAAPAAGWDPVDLYRERYAETAGAEPLARMQDVDLGIYLVDDLLVKTDRASMAHSLELRVPFLDQRGRRVRPRAAATGSKVRGFAKKRLLRQALAPLLPREIVHGRKQGFSIPLAAWLRGPLEPFAREVLSPATLERQGCLDPAAVTPAARRATAPGSEDLSRQLWGLMALHPLVRPLCPLTRSTRSSPSSLAGRPRAAPGAADRVGWRCRVGAIDQPNERSPARRADARSSAASAILAGVARRRPDLAALATARAARS